MKAKRRKKSTRKMKMRKRSNLLEPMNEVKRRFGQVVYCRGFHCVDVDGNRTYSESCAGFWPVVSSANE